MGDRTPDLRNAIATLSQLSYGPLFAGPLGGFALPANPFVVRRRRAPPESEKGAGFPTPFLKVTLAASAGDQLTC